MKTFKNINY